MVIPTALQAVLPFLANCFFSLFLSKDARLFPLTVCSLPRRDRSKSSPEGGLKRSFFFLQPLQAFHR